MEGGKKAREQLDAQRLAAMGSVVDQMAIVQGEATSSPNCRTGEENQSAVSAGNTFISNESPTMKVAAAAVPVEAALHSMVDGEDVEAKQSRRAIRSAMYEAAIQLQGKHRTAVPNLNRLLKIG